MGTGQPATVDFLPFLARTQECVRILLSPNSVIAVFVYGGSQNYDDPHPKIIKKS